MKNDSLSIYIDVLIEKNTSSLEDYPIAENVKPNHVITSPFDKQSVHDEVLWDWDFEIADIYDKV